MKKAVYSILVFTTCKKGMEYAYRASDNNKLSCVKYSFDKSKNTLTLKHVNAGFNCCPGKLYVETSLSGNTIMIKEHESESSCKCQCLYDLDIVLTGVEAKKYKIEIVEPYATRQQQIIFEVNLENDNEGDFCVKREGYPWGS